MFVYRHTENPYSSCILSFFSDAYSLVCYSVTENGFAAKSDALLSLPEVVHDADRVEYFRGYSNALLEAVMLDGVPVKSYFAWSEFRSRTAELSDICELIS